jgi:hypothetical protein
MNERHSTARLLPGLQAGMAGALVMLAWLALAMLWSKHSIWWFPNLMATTFGGEAALRLGFGKYTAAGLALHLIQFSFLGAIFALVMPAQMRRGRAVLIGVIVGVAWFYLMYGLVWKHLNPIIPLYSPDRQILVGHVFFGMMLGRVSRYDRAAMAETFPDTE